MFDTIMGADKLSIPCAVSQVANCSVELFSFFEIDCGLANMQVWI